MIHQKQFSKGANATVTFYESSEPLACICVAKSLFVLSGFLAPSLKNIFFPWNEYLEDEAPAVRELFTNQPEIFVLIQIQILLLNLKLCAKYLSERSNFSFFWQI